MRFKTCLLTQGRVVSEQVPISDTTIGTGWAQGAGDSDGDTFDELDEGRANYDDATTFWSRTGAGVGGTVLKCKLTPRDTPTTPTIMSVSVRWRCTVGDMPNVHIKVYSPAGTLRKDFSHSITVAGGWTTTAENGDLSAISDWTDVHIEAIDQDDTAGEILDVSGFSINQGA